MRRFLALLCTIWVTSVQARSILPEELIARWRMQLQLMRHEHDSSALLEMIRQSTDELNQAAAEIRLAPQSHLPPPQSIRSLFGLRIVLRGRLAETSARNDFRELYYAIRNVEIALGERLKKDSATESLALTTENHYLLLARDSGHYGAVISSPEVLLQSGDVLLMSGPRVNKSVITRIQNFDGPFSHQGIVYQNPKTQKWYIIEALFAEGVVATPLYEALQDLDHVLLLRLKPETATQKALPQLAAEKAFQLTQGLRPFAKPIPYDLSHRSDTYLRFSAAKFIHWAYREASGGQMQMMREQAAPTGLPHLSEYLGLSANNHFPVSDAEFDTRFAIEAEWQNYARTPQRQVYDLILNRLDQGMQKGRVTMNGRPMFQRAMRLVLSQRWLRSLARRTGLIDLPIHVPPRTVAPLMLLQQTVDQLDENSLPYLLATDSDVQRCEDFFESRFNVR